jgi:hypothetical protein
MKKIVLLIIVIATAVAGKGQNLVPNGDFEIHTNCIDGTISNAVPWSNPTGGTPDYFNQCASSGGFGVPDNGFGHQFAHSGNAYCGVILYYQDNGLGLYREYIEAPLTALTAGTCYHFEMYMNLTEVYSRYNTTDVGVYFSNTLISGVPGHYPLPYTPQIINPAGNYPDTIGWTLVSGNYTALGGESYLIIGNFGDSINPDTVLFNSSITWNESYVFIDDVSLTPCTGIEQLNNIEAITIYPNPAKEYFGLRISDFGLNKKYELKIIDILGKEILKSAINNPQSEINIKSFQKGIYFVEINNGKTVYRKKLVKE